MACLLGMGLEGQGTACADALCMRLYKDAYKVHHAIADNCQPAVLQASRQSCKAFCDLEVLMQGSQPFPSLHLVS